MAAELFRTDSPELVMTSWAAAGTFTRRPAADAARARLAERSPERWPPPPCAAAHDQGIRRPGRTEACIERSGQAGSGAGQVPRPPAHLPVLERFRSARWPSR